MSNLVGTLANTIQTGVAPASSGLVQQLFNKIPGDTLFNAVTGQSAPIPSSGLVSRVATTATDRPAPAPFAPTISANIPSNQEIDFREAAIKKRLQDLGFDTDRLGRTFSFSQIENMVTPAMADPNQIGRISFLLNSPSLSDEQKFNIEAAIALAQNPITDADIQAAQQTLTPQAPIAPTTTAPLPAPAGTTPTPLGDISLGPDPQPETPVGSVEELIETRQPTIEDILRQTTEEAQRLDRLAREQAVAELQPFVNLDAQREQEAILGLLGGEAQAAAVAGIPVSEFEQEMRRRQRENLLRGAAARGGLGSGATVLEGQQLGAGQQAETVQRRLASLDPLANLSRRAAAQIAAIEEQTGTTEAGRESQLGNLLANLRLTSQLPISESELAEATNLANERLRIAQEGGQALLSATELRNAQRIASAQSRGQLLTGLAGLAGAAAPSISSAFRGFGTTPTATLQTGFNQNFFPQAGLIGIA